MRYRSISGDQAKGASATVGVVKIHVATKAPFGESDDYFADAEPVGAVVDELDTPQRGRNHVGRSAVDRCASRGDRRSTSSLVDEAEQATRRERRDRRQRHSLGRGVGVDDHRVRGKHGVSRTGSSSHRVRRIVKAANRNPLLGKGEARRPPQINQAALRALEVD